MLLFLSVQMCLLSLVEFLCLAWQNDDDKRLKIEGSTIERAIVLLSAVACFVGSCAVFVVFRVR